MVNVIWTFLFVVVLLALAGFIWILVPFGLRRVSERRLQKECRAARQIVLSFDDGPDPEITPALLELMRKEDVQASFFLIGDRADAYSDIVRRQIEDGHEVGSHTEQHLHAWRISPIRNLRDIATGIKAISELGGNGLLFRPPWGKMTAVGMFFAWMKRCQLGWWTVDSQDAWDPREIGDILREIDRKGGGVVLMHDTIGPRAVKNTVPRNLQDILELTKALIAHAKENNYRITRLGDIYNHK